jgi:hypothetical protein
VGSSANDGSGDPIRSSFQKINANESAINSELVVTFNAASLVGSDLQLTRVNGTTLNVDLSSLGGSETVTALSYNAGTNTLTYTDENSATTNLDLSNLSDSETLTSLAFNAGTNTLTYTDENGTPTDLDLSTLSADLYITGAAFDNVSKTLTLSDADGGTADVTVDLSELAGSLVDNTDGTYTYDPGTGVTVTIDTNKTFLDLTDGPAAYTGEAGKAVVVNATEDGVEFGDAVSHADAISPASDDATGAIGISTDSAREDHKHPAQGVSADANNELSVGTDGLHFFDGWDRVFLSNTAVAPALAGSPTINEISTAAGTNRNEILYFTGTDVGTDAPTHIYHIDKSGAVTLLMEPFVQAPSSDAFNRITTGSDGLHHYSGSTLTFIGDTATAPAIAGLPTDAEALAAAGSGTVRDIFVYYNGTDVVNTETATHVWYIDSDGFIGRLRSPAASSELTSTKIDSSGGASVETLAASTNLGAVKLFTNIDVTNSASLTVQAGETLNGVTDGTFLFSNYTAGTQFRADEVNGGWVVSVAGASTTNTVELTTGSVNDITQVSGSTVVYNSNPSAGQISINSVEYYDEGSFRHLRVDFVSDDDDQIVLQVGGSLMPTGGKIIDVQCLGTSLASDPGNPLTGGLVAGQDAQFFVNRIDSLDADTTFSVWLKILNTNAGSVVLAGMVTPELSRVSTLLDDLEVAELDGIQVRPNQTNQQFEIKSASGAITLTNFRPAYFLETGNVGGNLAPSSKALTDGAWSTVWQDLTLNIGLAGGHEKATFTHNGNDYILFAETGSSWSANRVVIERVQQMSVVMPDALTPETLQRASRYSQATGNFSAPGIYTEGSGVTYDPSGMLTAGLHEYTIPETGTYRITAMSGETTTHFNSYVRVNGANTYILGNASDDDTKALSVLADLTAGDVVDFWRNDGGTISIVNVSTSIEQLPTHTVATPDTLSVSDQSTSGYMDIGDMRMQWGSGSGSGVTEVTSNFPAPFADTSYRVTASTIGGGNGQTISIQSKTTTSFNSTQVDVTGTPRSNSFDWIAIGLKP